MTENTNYHGQEDEITLKELILKIKEFTQEVLKYWFWILVIGIFLGVYMSYKAYQKPSFYQAELTFMVNDDEGGGSMAGLGGLLGSFGLGGGGGGKNNLDKILELSKTRKINQKVLFEKVNVGNKVDYLANHIINHKDSIGEWENKPFYNFWSKESELKNFRFKHDSISIFNRTENRVMKKVHIDLVGGIGGSGIVSSGYTKESGIMYLRASTRNSDLSIALCNILYGKLSQYYVTKTIEKQKFTFDIVKTKYDSIQVALKSAQYTLAKFKDRNQNMFSKVNNLEELRLNQEVQKLGIMYGEAAKNIEIADFSLKNKTPFVQEIDTPIAPLNGSRSSLIKALFVGGVLGIFLSIIFIVIRKVYNDTME